MCQTSHKGPAPYFMHKVLSVLDISNLELGHPISVKLIMLWPTNPIESCISMKCTLVPKPILSLDVFEPIHDIDSLIIITYISFETSSPQLSITNGNQGISMEGAILPSCIAIIH